MTWYFVQPLPIFLSFLSEEKYGSKVTYRSQIKVEKILFANIPAMGGKKKEHASLIRVNFQPMMPTSIGNRLTAHNDQPVKKATIVPMLAPARKRAAAIGKLT